jgi:16S rRNA (guanine966-N2)-methyltransferase
MRIRKEEAVILRVISGSARGHKLKTIKGLMTRPTSGLVKEALFSIIASRLGGSHVLDLFAGSGSLGIEALSRGAEFTVFIDRNPRCCSIIKENLVHTKLSEMAEVYSMDYQDAIRKMSGEQRKFDIIFMDPPYNKNFVPEALKLLTNNDIMKDDGIIIAEHGAADVLPETCGRFRVTDCRGYGDTIITIYEGR